jgi:hypothetical protein
MATLRSDLDAAEAFADEALALANRADISDGFAVYGGQLFVIRMMQGRLDELVELFVAAVEATPTLEALRVAVVTMLIELGDLDGARERFAYERESGFSYVPRSQWYMCMTDMADAAVDLDDREAAAVLLDRLRPYVDRIAFSHAVPPRLIARPAARLAALIGLEDEAERFFALALAQADRLDSPHLIARTHLDRAEMFVRNGTGDRERAAHDVNDASNVLAEFGAGSLERRAEQLGAALTNPT